MNKSELKKVRKKIKESGLKIGFIAVKIGLHPGSLSAYLTGQRDLGLPTKLSLFRELNLTYEDSDKAS